MDHYKKLDKSLRSNSAQSKNLLIRWLNLLNNEIGYWKRTRLIELEKLNRETLKRFHSRSYGKSNYASSCRPRHSPFCGTKRKGTANADPMHEIYTVGYLTHKVQVYRSRDINFNKVYS